MLPPSSSKYYLPRWCGYFVSPESDVCLPSRVVSPLVFTRSSPPCLINGTSDTTPADCVSLSFLVTRNQHVAATFRISVDFLAFSRRCLPPSYRGFCIFISSCGFIIRGSNSERVHDVARTRIHTEPYCSKPHGERGFGLRYSLLLQSYEHSDLSRGSWQYCCTIVRTIVPKCSKSCNLPYNALNANIALSGIIVATRATRCGGTCYAYGAC